MAPTGLWIDAPRSAPKPHRVTRRQQAIVPTGAQCEQHAEHPPPPTTKAPLAVLRTGLLQCQPPDVEDLAQTLRRALRSR